MFPVHVMLSGLIKTSVGLNKKFKTFRDVASYSGLDEDTLRRWRTGRTFPRDLTLLTALLQAIEVPEKTRLECERAWHAEHAQREDRRKKKLAQSLVGQATSQLPKLPSLIDGEKNAISHAEFLDKKCIVETVELGRKLVGDSHIDLETLLRRHEVNPHIVTGLYQNPHELIGYYILYPLIDDCYNRILNIDIVNGRGIRYMDIHPSFLEARAVYIGMIGGKGGHANGYIVQELISQVSSLLHSGTLRAVFARGATESGIKMLRRFEFQRLPAPSEISCAFISEDYLQRNKVKRNVQYR